MSQARAIRQRPRPDRAPARPRQQAPAPRPGCVPMRASPGLRRCRSRARPTSRPEGNPPRRREGRHGWCRSANLPSTTRSARWTWRTTSCLPVVDDRDHGVGSEPVRRRVGREASVPEATHTSAEGTCPDGAVPTLVGDEDAVLRQAVRPCEGPRLDPALSHRQVREAALAPTDPDALTAARDRVDDVGVQSRRIDAIYPPVPQPIEPTSERREPGAARQRRRAPARSPPREALGLRVGREVLSRRRSMPRARRPSRGFLRGPRRRPSRAKATAGRGPRAVAPEAFDAQRAPVLVPIHTLEARSVTMARAWTLRSTTGLRP